MAKKKTTQTVVLDEAVIAVIKKTVGVAINAQRVFDEEESKEVIVTTTERLGRYWDLKKRIEYIKDELAIGVAPTPGKSGSVVRYIRAGQTVDPDEWQLAWERDMDAKLFAAEREIAIIDKAIEVIREDPYGDIIKGKYLEGKSEEALALQMHCDRSTISRNKARLIRRIAVFLYGTFAIT